MTFIFGPVPSRRLGRSLGVDPVPSKTCNWNCVYCQLGRSQPVINERRDYVDNDAVIAELRTFLQERGEETLDWITFVGSGETTLHAGIGELISTAKSLTTKPVAVITNGSLLHLENVRRALLPADAVLPSLDAGSAELHRRLTRAHPDCTFERHVQGLRAFRREFAGHLWIEVMLIAGANDDETALRDLRDVLETIEPEEVHLLTPSRAPAETWVAEPEQAVIERAARILSKAARVVTPTAQVVEITGGADAAETIAAIVARHPMTEAQLRQVTRGIDEVELTATLQRLARAGRIRSIERNGERFYTAGAGRYARS
jgi:wyosine [tRNA(Phe)-imidazoG37] synthetase (radical SAM superfamily)